MNIKVDPVLSPPRQMSPNLPPARPNLATMVPVPRRNLYSTKSGGLLWTLRRNIVFVQREGGGMGRRAGREKRSAFLNSGKKEGRTASTLKNVCASRGDYK